MYEGPERRSDQHRLGKIEATVERLVFILEEDTKNRADFRNRIEALLKDHTIAIYGDRDGVGLNARVNTLETAHKNHQGNIRVMWAAVVGIIFTALWKAITLSFVK